MYEVFSLKSGMEGMVGYDFEASETKFVMCLVHGIGEYCGRYKRMAEFLNKNGITVVGIDLRGHGRSSGKRGHCAPRGEVLKDIDGLISYARDKYQDVPLILYGHSMGGNIVLDYRHRGGLNSVPDGYIISAPWVRLCRKIPKPLYSVVSFLSYLCPTFTIGSACNEQILGNQEYVRPYNDDPLVHPKISLQCAVEGFEIGRQLENNEVATIGSGIKKPMLLMHGTEDMICDIEGSRAIASYEENCEFVEWDGYYHEIHNGGPQFSGEEVLKAIRDYIFLFT